MTKNNLILLGVWLLIIGLLISIGISREKTKKQQTEIEIKLDPPQDTYIHNEFKVTGTYYNPVSAQCQGNPLITADGSKINQKKLKLEKIRWVALSRDLIKRWGGHFDYGDTIYVHHKHPDVNGLWVVRDCMNARFTNRIDFLVHLDNDFVGMVRGALIYKL